MIDSGALAAETINKAIRAVIDAEPLAKIDYVEVVNFDTIEAIDTLDGIVLTAIAVYIGKTRLIDNFIMTIQS